MEQRIAIVETELRFVREDLAEIKTDIKTLLAERNEGIGKKSVWAVIYGAIGAVIVAIIGAWNN